MTIGRKTGGRVRTVFCGECKITPKLVRDCKPCTRIYESGRKAKNREKFLLLRREYYSKNKARELENKNASRKKKWGEYLHKEKIRKDRVRYGEFASAHRALIKTKQIIRGMGNEN